VQNVIIRIWHILPADAYIKRIKTNIESLPLTLSYVKLNTDANIWKQDKNW
jgi:hypothetical protein